MKKTCFIIMRFSNMKLIKGKIEKEDCDFLLKSVFRRSLTSLGYTVIRGDTSNKSGSIIIENQSGVIS